jgi:hypothetical protein
LEKGKIDLEEETKVEDTNSAEEVAEEENSSEEA